MKQFWFHFFKEFFKKAFLAKIKEYFVFQKRRLLNGGKRAEAEGTLAMPETKMETSRKIPNFTCPIP